MTRTKVTCCSCFIERCVCFCEMKANFEDLMSANFDLFIKETREHCVLNGPLIYTEHVIACLDCFMFQLWNLSIENIRIFDKILRRHFCWQ